MAPCSPVGFAFDFDGVFLRFGSEFVYFSWCWTVCEWVLPQGFSARGWEVMEVDLAAFRIAKKEDDGIQLPGISQGGTFLYDFCLWVLLLLLV